ncbi:Transmembrane protein 249 [Amphibalanus amphitrite]|uniref:Transmembrane protein 249 n=1 Tax=Amphibalanus amphitrite TaxID=1232801 RepID=A0A6A4WLT0_AMPAM|nr:transmembrane protein 249-like [Amphibalanus amphitrite]KAF0294665.1 Transmembrane protein 249 [Amphibalanus amphitrite]KAF0303128.1 Transmembrane protein 249 [Amphibalanus amphitrite]KAF0303129.1 Transmembrane protein 249 [Amphibalanus amphitrite]
MILAGITGEICWFLRTHFPFINSLTRDGPEYLLYKMLEAPPRPFVVRDDGKWELRYRKTWLYTYIIGLAIVVPILVDVVLKHGSLNFTVILSVSAVVLAWKTYVHYPLHIIIIDKRKNVYEYHKRGRLITTEPLYNMYIRLIGQKCYPSPGGSKSSNWFFYLCLKGVGLEEFKLSPHTEYEDRMRKLGKRLSRKLGINYFDFIDESPLHDVRHRPVQISIPTWAPA